MHMHPNHPTSFLPPHLPQTPTSKKSSTHLPLQRPRLGLKPARPSRSMMMVCPRYSRGREPTRSSTVVVAAVVGWGGVDAGGDGDGAGVVVEGEAAEGFIGYFGLGDGEGEGGEEGEEEGGACVLHVWCLFVGKGTVMWEEGVGVKDGRSVFLIERTSLVGSGDTTIVEEGETVRCWDGKSGGNRC